MHQGTANGDFSSIYFNIQFYPAPPVTFVTGERVTHTRHGKGTVLRVLGELVTVEYDNPIDNELYIAASNTSTLSKGAYVH